MKSLVFENQKHNLNSQSFIVFLISISFIISNNIQLLICIFPYIFAKNTIHKLIYILPIFTLYWINTNLFIQYVSFITLYFILNFIVRKLRGNTTIVNQIYVSSYSFIVSYMATNDIYSSLILFVIQIVYYQELTKSNEGSNDKIPFIINNLTVLSIMLFTIQYMNNYHELFVILGIIYICFNNSPTISIISMLFISIYTSIISYDVLIYILIISLLKDKLGLMLLLYITLFFSKTIDLYILIILGLYLSFYLLFNKNEITEEIKTIKMDSSLNKQLNNFSLIFEHLSTYYENISSVESNFLKSMSNALEYTSKKCIYDDKDQNHIRNKVISILEGYDIGYEKVLVEMDEEGFIRLKCKLLSIKENEIKELLLPLLNHILPTEMECVSIRKNWLELGVINVEFASCPPIRIDAYADSTQTGNTCGDSFSIFHHSSKVYCLISDGMGRGIEASRISKCIVHLFQRMIFSNIHEIEAMNCINKLLLSDAYATCDILIFNRFRKTVNICKSAANPTYLIRNNEIYAIWGNSLPIGIVAHIDVDQIVVYVEKGDWFVMSSDGVELDEIMRWTKENKEQCARKEVEYIMDNLKEKIREDDSTILLAKVI